MDVTPKAIAYLMPLIQGESFPNFRNGIPEIKELKLKEVKKKLKLWV
jgi:6-phosphofructokinase 1